jgi:hypothetical protein
MRLPNVKLNEYNEVLFISKINRAARLGVRSIALCAIDRLRAFDRGDIRSTANASSVACARSSELRSTAMCSIAQ